ncbi:putative sucrose-phosphate synthase 1 [Prunus yedoensis var. nudiflora]|uniref:Sucrose-phosphate synthase n=1 Tax=Prunus yedoensis var. nudiflora TaxID=2094558 RepID=A0A314U5M1_PRUYE|nr:putative sucrose-phosphate synthase 1 [Prunus yedoensis var. nudiflora]
MAGNDWVNSYLEAILDVGPGLDDAKSSLLLRERGRFSPTRYFVEEVITRYDETDLHRSWVRAAATARSPEERNTRLENMCWRIWNLARKKKQLEGEEAQRMAKWRLERERGRREATEDMSEDLSEGEKGDTVGDLSAHSDSNRGGKMKRISSADAMENWASQQKEKKFYIVLISLHGLIRGENMELGRDSDTGGQVKYVVELARALGSMPGVYRVDLLTRQVSAPDVDWSYGEPTEMLNPIDSENSKDEHGESSGAYIIRIPFGPKDKYIPKENLWPHIPEFVDGALNHIIQISKALGEQIGAGQPVWPVAIHGHYADAGDSAALLSGALNVPMVFTGHSLGRDKLEQLLKQGRQSREEINTTYKIMRRIEAEELTLDASEIVITSTRQEIESQWRLYDGFDPILERKLRARIKRGVSCHGRFMPRMVVIPPGMEFHHIIPHDGDVDGEGERHDDSSTSPDPPIWSEIMRFFTNPRKPMILALARADPKKNITTLVKAFGECRPLRELANLTLIMGNRDDIDEMPSTNASVLLSILKLIDRYDLYGHVAYPKHHKQSDVPDIYRLAAKTKGVFINPAFIEPFGLTLIEAAAYGLPIVATQNGGPVDIHRVLDNGLLVDPHDQQSIADALLKLVSDKQLWARCRQNGLKNIHLFSWPEHCKTYLSRITSCKPRQPQWQRSDAEFDNSDSDSPSDSLRDIQDISLNLKLSLDGDKTEGTGALDNALESDERAAGGKIKEQNTVLTLSRGVLRGSPKAGPAEKEDNNSGVGKFPGFRKKKYVCVIAVDCDTTSEFTEIIEKVVEAAGKDKDAGSIGFILSTALAISEIHSLLISGGLSPSQFDAFICNSGGELYYPSSSSDDSPSGLPFVVDLDYRSHIEYRWGGECLRKTLVRWVASFNEKKGGQTVTEHRSGSTNHCYAYKVKDLALIPPVKELRKLMRIQGLRCHVIYSQNGTRLNVIPVLASRSQALRYLYVRWGLNLSTAVVFVGESGDTDYEGLLGGLHRTVILKGVSCGARKLHANRNYSLEDVFPNDSPNMTQSEGCSQENIRASLSKLGILKR